VPKAQAAQTANALHKVEATTTTVYMTIIAKAEATAYEIKADGTVIFAQPEVTMAAPNLQKFFTFRLKPNAEWEVKVTKGTLTEIKTSYQEG
jgi:hypothetical protein